MTEQEWLESSDPCTMVDFVFRSMAYRSLRLFSVACCRRIYHLIKDERSRAAVETAERFAEECAVEKEFFNEGAARAAEKELNEAAARAAEVIQPPPDLTAYYAAHAAYYAAAPESHPEVHPACMASLYAAKAVASSTGLNRNSAEWEAAVSVEQAQQCKIFHELLGPLVFRLKLVDQDWWNWWNPDWRTPDVIAIAQMIYQQNRLEDLPILADALEEAGCTNAEFLDHCRQPTGHLRGCWVLAWILQLLD